MNGYVLSVIGTVLLSAVLTAIIPNGKTASVIKGVAKLACVIAIVAPVLNFFHSAGGADNDKKTQGIFSETVIQTDEEFIKYYSEIQIEYAEAALESELSELYSAETQVTFTWRTVTESYAGIYPWDKIQITKIHIKNLNKQTEEVITAMWEHVTKNYCSEVLIE